MGPRSRPFSKRANDGQDGHPNLGMTGGFGWTSPIAPGASTDHDGLISSRRRANDHLAPWRHVPRALRLTGDQVPLDRNGWLASPQSTLARAGGIASEPSPKCNNPGRECRRGD